MFHFSYVKRIFILLFVFVLSGSLSVWAQSLDSKAEAELNLRMNAIEDQMRRMNGDVERLSFEIRQLTERLTKFSEDIEFRLKEIQGGKSVPSNSQIPPGGNSGSGPVKLGPRSDNSPGGGNSTAAGPRVLGQIPANGSPDGAKIASLDGAVAASPPKTLYETSYDKLHRKDYVGAERGFKTFIQQNPKSELVSNAHYWLGESFYARQQYRDAARFFLKGYKDYPKGRKAPDNLFKLGMTLKKLGQKDQACAAYAEAKRRFPRADKTLKKKIQGEIRKSGC